MNWHSCCQLISTAQGAPGQMCDFIRPYCKTSLGSEVGQSWLPLLTSLPPLTQPALQRPGCAPCLPACLMLALSLCSLAASIRRASRGQGAHFKDGKWLLKRISDKKNVILRQKQAIL